VGPPIWIVDAFADRPFAGNPAAVCVLDAPADPPWMQRVAAEMNLSETAFVHPDRDGAWWLRWFTPAVEVALCGHATLAAAHALWELGLVPPDQPARFETASGLLAASREGPLIVLDFPATPVGPWPTPDGLADALGADPKWVGMNRFDLFVVLEDEATVAGLRPDFAALGRVEARGVIVTARSTEPSADFVSRFFAPASGIDEDPVTGSAHCALGPYWGPILGKTELVGRQLSARGGEVRVGLDGKRVRLGGRAFTVMRGRLDAEADGPS